MRRTALRAIALILALAIIGARAPVLGQGGQARLRTANAVPGGPAVDVLAGANRTFSNVAFTQVTPYQSLNAGTTNLQIVPAGGQGALASTSANLRSATDHTLVAVGMPTSVEALLLTDDNRPPSPGQARVRLVHASPDAPAVDVAVAGGQTLFSNVPYKGVGNYVSINAGTINLQVREAGTSTVLVAAPMVALNACTVYTIFLMGLRVGQPPLQVVTSSDAVTTCAPGAAPPAPTQPRAATPVRTAAPRATGVLTATLTTTPATPVGTRTATGSATAPRTAAATAASPTAGTAVATAASPTAGTAVATAASPTAGTAVATAASPTAGGTDTATPPTAPTETPVAAATPTSGATETAAIQASATVPATAEGATAPATEMPPEQPTAAPPEQATAAPPEQATAAPPEQPTAAPPEQPPAAPPEQPPAAPPAWAPDWPLSPWHSLLHMGSGPSIEYLALPMPGSLPQP